ncbi:MAG TPA: alpha/beta fold hydrolase, partial [Chthoniobacteraceae bacterium]|nr:alpha/beta fold hydrolase [Chthoniobacteraceae bacterium]
MKRVLLRLLRALALAWVALVILVAVFQRSLIYFPSRAPEPALIAEAQRDGLEPWRDAGGQIIGWRRIAGSRAQPANRLLVFHGNAGYALHRWYYAAGFGELDGGQTWDVHLFEYPGYGARPGTPGEKSFNAAAAAALETLGAGDARPIFVLGESVGSGPACALASAHPREIAGVCLITPFARLSDVAAHHYPFLPVRLLLRDRWDNAAALANYPGRLAVRLAGDDEIIPAAQGRLLFDR